MNFNTGLVYERGLRKHNQRHNTVHVQKTRKADVEHESVRLGLVQRLRLGLPGHHRPDRLQRQRAQEKIHFPAIHQTVPTVPQIHQTDLHIAQLYRRQQHLQELKVAQSGHQFQLL